MTGQCRRTQPRPPARAPRPCTPSSRWQSRVSSVGSHDPAVTLSPPQAMPLPNHRTERINGAPMTLSPLEAQPLPPQAMLLPTRPPEAQLLPPQALPLQSHRQERINGAPMILSPLQAQPTRPPEAPLLPAQALPLQNGSPKSRRSRRSSRRSSRGSSNSRRRCDSPFGSLRWQSILAAAAGLASRGLF